MEKVEKQIVTVGSAYPRWRKALIIGIIVGLLVIGTVVAIVAARYIANKKNKFEGFDLETYKTEMTVTIATTGTTTTAIPLILNSSNISNTEYTSYIKSESDIMKDRHFSLESTLTYNSDDEILFNGYITMINISFNQLFNIFNANDFRIHFLTIINNTILSDWTTIPSDNSLFDTYILPLWSLIVKPGSFLCVATYSYDISSVENSNVVGNSISATYSGKAYISSHFSSANAIIQPRWNGEETGIALSFTIAHNPEWTDVTTSTTTTTTTGTPIPNINTTYGYANEDVLDEMISLNSVLIFNWDGTPITRGYVIKINIKFCTPFRSEYTLDGLLWFFITDGRTKVLQRYSVKPSSSSLIQSFLIPLKELIIGKDNYLSVGTFSNNSNKTNTICLKQSGDAYSAVIIDNIPDNTINAQWKESEIGIALGYVVFSSQETMSGVPEGADTG